MKRYSLLLTFLLVGLVAQAAEKTSFTFYLQLIRGNDDDRPPAANATAVGPRLSHRLNSVFRWKNYWEIKRDSVTVSLGEKVRSKLTSDRDVEIELFGKGDKMVVRVYRDGKLVRSRTRPRQGFYITGGDKDARQAWFIIVRDDKPSQEPGK